MSTNNVAQSNDTSNDAFEAGDFDATSWLAAIGIEEQHEPGALGRPRRQVILSKPAVETRDVVGAAIVDPYTGEIAQVSVEGRRAWAEARVQREVRSLVAAAAPLKVIARHLHRRGRRLSTRARPRVSPLRFSPARRRRRTPRGGRRGPTKAARPKATGDPDGDVPPPRRACRRGLLQAPRRQRRVVGS